MHLSYMKCTVCDLEVMISNLGQVELGVRSTSVVLETKTSLSLPRVTMLPSQCSSNGPGNLDSNKTEFIRKTSSFSK